MQLGVGKADIPSADLPSHCVPHPFSCFALHRGKPPIANESAYSEADVRLSREKKEKRRHKPASPETGVKTITDLRHNPSKRRKKSSGSVCETLSELKKISGAVLLSHSRIYSTIAAGVLNCRVREGNVCCYPAMSTGKKHNKEKVYRKNPEEMRRTQILRVRLFS